MSSPEPSSDLGRRRAARRDSGKPAFAERRAEIVTAAARVFSGRGYARTTLADVAAELGMDRASLYHYVGSKQELFQDVVGETVERNAERAEAIAAGPGTPADKLRELVTEMMASYARSHPFLYVYLQEDLRAVTPDRSEWAQHMRRVNKRYENAVVAIVAAGADDGTFAVRGDPYVVAAGVIGMVSWTNRWFDPGTSTFTAAEIARTYADTLVLGLSAG
ncbi:hypothetical protein ASG36_08585 [Geodermatophilus sp. Leaf369]|uniref:TetR/AcrR family transcriptional regulator n=1 Tax=Geodermatophilus sp. Leaf369 TaxID=1736354 RepID=UPI0006FA5F28|nr:TetR/AcrR family transcriptional regulator [Geodermatophilus sp. Leaf369]KQS60887.1 hypothetical protein ASG36_08585 [Geodermatophilus sp. Leaf369]